MCGRYVITSPPEVLRALFGYPEQPNFPPRYNVAPTQPVPVVRFSEGRRQFALVRWGLIPSWVKDPRGFTLLINARGESAAEKPAFRAAMKRRRCLVPADGFYEWRRIGLARPGDDRDASRRQPARTVAAKQPFFIHARDSRPLAFAGIWETWTGPDGEEMETAAIVTTAANRTLQPIHDRMPVIVPPAAFDLWLDPNVDADAASAVIAPAPDDLLEAYEISTAVNRTVNDSADLIARLAPGAEAPPSPDGKTPKPARKKDDRQASLF
ncbi:MAG: SOS response-associated peptidase [Xanthobacteraceae bacterium]|nr:SOS response-associated peptidase [Xanthobacteraceae bacterium]